MTEDGRKDTFRVGAGQGEGIGMADARGGDAYQHLASLRRRHIDFDNLHGLVGSKGYGSSRFDHYCYS